MRFTRPGFIFERITLWPSFLCFDAPLVAGVWTFFLWDHRGDDPSRGLSCVALSSAVWSIYLFDRLYDSTNNDPGGETTLRHRFASRHRRWLRILMVLAGIGSVLCATQLTWFQLGAGIILGAGTLLYYTGFRFIRGQRQRFSHNHRLPWKESIIAACFALGILLVSKASPFEVHSLREMAALFLIFLANCLIISRAEASLDAMRDQHAFYSSGPRSRTGAAMALCLGIGLATTTFRSGSSPTFGLATISAALLLGAILCLPSRFDAVVQALADGALVVAPLVVFGVWHLL